ncbi:hypothetical protein KIN20_013260 [Parelaphostrongylus tenuis]|uniref:Uncharacterized protein n=1 Tax=Parelaphostrongylus tenuis TaxID=148309 RepID=A0AAD5QNE0_PARTN|nr:hypothetical protein KIN20_013260 [Parelaphostrongylus tenuis]
MAAIDRAEKDDMCNRLQGRPYGRDRRHEKKTLSKKGKEWRSKELNSEMWARAHYRARRSVDVET